ncbi:MAG: metallophosphoesterase [Patescibacteria group bacterium]
MKRNETIPLIILLIVSICTFVHVVNLMGYDEVFKFSGTRPSTPFKTQAALSKEGSASLAEGFLAPLEKEKAFTVIVLPDTQKYSAEFPHIMCNQTEWIVANRERLNILFVSHMGDIVDDVEEEKQWKAASECMSRLDGKVPYGIIPGNHDQSSKVDFDMYNQYFPLSRFSTHPSYGGNYKENRNNYSIVTFEGKDFLFLNLEIEPTDDVLDWAAEVTRKNSSAYIIMTTHKYLPDYGSERDKKLEYRKTGNTGQKIWDKFIEESCNVNMTWSGHFHSKGGENRITSEDKCGNTIYQITQDYQSQELGGSGKLRIYTFKPSEKLIDVKTYSPFLDMFETDKSSQFQIPLVY